MHDFHREIHLVVQEMHHLSGAKRQAFVLRRYEYESLVIRVIRDCVDAGVIRSDEPDTIARFILGAINWMYLWYRPNGRLSPQNLSTLVGDMVIHGLEVRPGAEAHEAASSAATRSRHSTSPSGPRVRK
jgi:TetR/AcrR family transcriptional regulator, cholesterol catabolism regulator